MQRLDLLALMHGLAFHGRPRHRLLIVVRTGPASSLGPAKKSLAGCMGQYRLRALRGTVRCLGAFA